VNFSDSVCEFNRCSAALASIYYYVCPGEANSSIKAVIFVEKTVIAVFNTVLLFLLRIAAVLVVFCGLRFDVMGLTGDFGIFPFEFSQVADFSRVFHGCSMISALCRIMLKIG